MVFAPGEVAPPGQLYIIKGGLALFGGRVLGKGSVFGDDVILTSAHLLQGFAARAMNFLEVLTITREELEQTAAAFPEVARDLRKKSVRLAVRRAFLYEASHKRKLERARARRDSGETASSAGESFAQRGGRGGGALARSGSWANLRGNRKLTRQMTAVSMFGKRKAAQQQRQNSRGRPALETLLDRLSVKKTEHAAAAACFHRQATQSFHHGGSFEAQKRRGERSVGMADAQGRSPNRRPSVFLGAQSDASPASKSPLSLGNSRAASPTEMTTANAGGLVAAASSQPAAAAAEGASLLDRVLSWSGSKVSSSPCVNTRHDNGTDARGSEAERGHASGTLHQSASFKQKVQWEARKADGMSQDRAVRGGGAGGGGGRVCGGHSALPTSIMDRATLEESMHAAMARSFEVMEATLAGRLWEVAGGAAQHAVERIRIEMQGQDSALMAGAAEEQSKLLRRICAIESTLCEVASGQAKLLAAVELSSQQQQEQYASMAPMARASDIGGSCGSCGSCGGDTRTTPSDDGREGEALGGAPRRRPIWAAPSPGSKRPPVSKPWASMQALGAKPPAEPAMWA